MCAAMSPPARTLPAMPRATATSYGRTEPTPTTTSTLPTVLPAAVGPPQCGSATTPPAQTSAIPTSPCDGAGIAYAVWEDWRSGGVGIYFASRPPATPGAPMCVSAMAPRDCRGAPGIAVNSAGDVAVVWTAQYAPHPDYADYLVFRPAGGVWMDPEEVPGTYSMMVQPLLPTVGGGLYGRRLGGIRRRGLRKFTSTPSLGRRAARGAQLRLSAGTTPSMAPTWRQTRPVRPMSCGDYGRANGTWHSLRQATSRRCLEQPRACHRSSIRPYLGSPVIGVDAAGNAYAAWTDTRNGDSDVYFAYRPAGGAWGANCASTTTRAMPHRPGPRSQLTRPAMPTRFGTTLEPQLLKWPSRLPGTAISPAPPTRSGRTPSKPRPASAAAVWRLARTAGPPLAGTC